jgi:hypothetical protein
MFGVVLDRIGVVNGTDFRVMNDPGRVEPGGASQQRRDQTSRLNGFGGAHAVARVCLGGFSYFEYVDIRGHLPGVHG